MAYTMGYPIAAQASESARAAFIRRTYAHLAGAIGAFVALEFVIFGIFSQFAIEETMMRIFSMPMSMLIVVFGFIGISWLANWWAMSDTSRTLQYAGLGLYVIAEALIFVPLLYIAIHVLHDKSILPTAGVLTLCLFGGLTTTALVTRKDFSFLAPILSIGGFLIMGVVICACFISGLHLGMWFSLLMVIFASGSILYTTSNVLHHYRTDQHVAASLALFAAVATLFYYILRILIQMNSNRS